MVQMAVVASLLDRLIGPDASVAASGFCSREAFIQSVVRDLECLLNSRTSSSGSACSTLMEYGISDSVGLNLLAESDRHKLIANISGAIRSFEPRMKNVDVTFLAHVDGGRRLLLSISASVVISGVAERVVFKTHFQPTGGIYKVQQG